MKIEKLKQKGLLRLQTGDFEIPESGVSKIFL